MHYIRVDELEIYPSAMLALRNGAAVDLTSVEFALLAELALHSGQVANREVLSRRVLGRAYSSSDRSLDNHVSHICRKLGPAADGRRLIVSVRGKGYMYRRFQPADGQQTSSGLSAKLRIAAEQGGDEPATVRRVQMSR